ncbi:MAG: hypothetical protein GF408_03820 [Candidatus Omnitrophica bacterium]|nr:hypothetical protein [Candidatus Omnitrophota bacterium]
MKMKLLKKILSLSMAALLLVSSPTVPFADTSGMSTRELALRAKQAEKIFNEQKALRNIELKKILQDDSLSRVERMRAVRDLQNTFRKKSRLLYAEYRLPFLERVLEETNATLPEGQKIKRTKGTDVYLRDGDGRIVRSPEGRPMLNPAHRGMDGGDLDLGGSPRAVEELSSNLEKYDVAVTSNTMDAPGYRDYGSVETTINIKGQTDIPGSEAHHTQVQMDSFSKETYTSFAMAEDQPGRALVEVNDDIKKGIKGFNTDPQKLLRSYDGDMQEAMQGMNKAALKSIDSGNVTDAQLKKILKETGLKRDVKKFKQQLRAIKKGHLASEMGLDEKNIRAYQEACRKTTEQALENAQKTAAAEMKAARGEIDELERLAESDDTPPAEREKYSKKAREMRHRLKDSEIRIEQSTLANREKLSGGNYDTYYEKKHGKTPASKTVPSPGKPGGISRIDAIKGGLKPDLLSMAGYGLAAYNVYDNMDRLEKGEITESDAAIGITKEVVDVGFGMVTDVASFAATGSIGAGAAGTVATIGVPLVVIGASSYFVGESVEEGLKTLNSFRNEEILEKISRSKTQESLNRLQIRAEELLKAGEATGDWRYFAEAEKIVETLERQYKLTGDTWYRDIADTVYKRIGDVRGRLEEKYGCSIYAVKRRMEEENQPELGELKATLDTPEGPALKEKAEPGQTLCFKVGRKGIWSEGHTIEWYINGRLYKQDPASSPSAGIFRFRLEEVSEEKYTVSVRCVDNTTGSETGKTSVSFKTERDLPGELASFDIEARLGDYAGGKLSGYASRGDILAFEAEVPHPETEEPVATNLLWQLYGPGNKPVQGARKSTQAYEKGGTRTYRFKMKLGGLEDGEYVMGLMHYLAAEPSIKTESTYPFSVYNSVRFTSLIVTPDRDRLENSPVIRNDQEPHFLMGYELKESIDEVKINCVLTDKTSQEVLYRNTFTRQKKSASGRETFGIKVPEGLVPVGHEAVFSAEIIPPDGKAQEKSAPFSVRAYELDLSVPDRLETGKKKNFSIGVPAEFEPPYRIDIETGEGLMIHRDPRSLKGTVTGIAGYGTRDKRSTLRVSVSDSRGRKGKASKTVSIRPKPKPGPPRDPVYRAPASTAKSYPIVWIRKDDRGNGTITVNGRKVTGTVDIRNNSRKGSWGALKIRINGTYNPSSGRMSGNISGDYTWWDSWTKKSTKGSCRGTFSGSKSSSGFRGTWRYHITVPKFNLSRDYSGSWHTR